MATARRLPTDAPTDHLSDDLPKVPAKWSRIDELNYSERAAWVHRDTGLRVTVKRDRKPTQMHTPETSETDTGFIASVRGEFGGKLTYDLAGKAPAYEAAIRFMALYPDGRFEVPHPNNRPWSNRPLDWRPEDD